MREGPVHDGEDLREEVHELVWNEGRTLEGQLPGKARAFEVSSHRLRRTNVLRPGSEGLLPRHLRARWIALGCRLLDRRPRSGLRWNPALLKAVETLRSRGALRGLLAEPDGE